VNYVTLKEAKQYLKLDADNTTDDDLLAVFIEWSTTFIEYYKGRHYDPRFETRVFAVPSSGRSSFGVFEPRLQPLPAQPALRLDEDLLEAETLTNGDGAVITDYLLEPANVYPKTRVRLKNGSAWQSDADGESRQVIALKGLWGSHDKYPQAWRDSGQIVMDNPLSSGATTITVAERTPFSAGQLLRIDDELMLIISTAPILTVERAFNGSSAAVHVTGSKILIWKPQGNITQACLRLVKWRYSQKDVDIFDKSYNTESGMMSIPTAIPVDVLFLLGASKVAL